MGAVRNYNEPPAWELMPVSRCVAHPLSLVREAWCQPNPPLDPVDAVIILPPRPYLPQVEQLPYREAQVLVTHLRQRPQLVPGARAAFELGEDFLPPVYHRDRLSPCARRVRRRVRPHAARLLQPTLRTAPPARPSVRVRRAPAGDGAPARASTVLCPPSPPCG